MTLSRKDRLQALGLWPMWRLRAPAPAGVEPAVEIEQPEQPEQPEKAQRPPPPAAAPNAANPLNTNKIAALALTKPESGSESLPEPVPVPQQVNTGLDASDIMTMEWDALNTAIHSCRRCELAKTRSQAVPGVGTSTAEWLFIGDAPGNNEDRQGEPFSGDIGQLLDAILNAIGLARGHNVYLTNMLKSRPPGNREPKPEEITACLPYLERQIELIQPKLIVALGRFTAQKLLGTDTPIGILRGQVHRYRGIPLVVTYHPSYLLHNPLDKAKVWEDMVLARRTMNELKSHTPTQ
jgi:uracil-DNA glycosylase